MSQVFISYRQTDDEQRKRVRSFGERLSRCDIGVILDQFFLEKNPAGPNQGWPKWSSDRALQTEFVLIIGTTRGFSVSRRSNRQAPASGPPVKLTIYACVSMKPTA